MNERINYNAQSRVRITSNTQILIFRGTKGDCKIGWKIWVKCLTDTVMRLGSLLFCHITFNSTLDLI